MKLIKKLSLFTLITVGIGFPVATDLWDRGIFYSRHTPEAEIRAFHLYKTTEEVQKAYERNYGNPKYVFPGGVVDEVKIYRNQFMISRITSKTLSVENAMATVDLLNNPDNFDWRETTWSLSDAEYLLRFFDSQGNETGKVWLCMEGCGMTKSIPFSPGMKFGGLSETGREKLENLLKRINED